MRSYLSRPLVRVVLNRHFVDIDAVAGKLFLYVFKKKKNLIQCILFVGGRKLYAEVQTKTGCH